ncbi:uncharacterized protein K02A2.6-like [Polypterus senegalus]|uniref:uncharacterized protein K02A2.6-like n=1 Tax=Polypterus senegalus TaxID=55291 RepID=UPI0019657AA3|nr:uncharacterized protein K02A2.6-like [Polypterus senegalus]
MRDHLSPKPLLIAEHFRFHKRNQNDGETIAAYVAELKKLSEYCQFGDGLNDALRDRLVCGILQEGIQKRLLIEADLTFKRAVEIAISMETAAKDALELQRGVNMSNVNKMAAAKINKVHKCPCYRCGRDSHLPSQCRFKNEECRQCHITGHIQKLCRSGKAKFSAEHKMHHSDKKNVHNVAEVSDIDSEDALASLELFSLSGKDKQAIWLTPKIDGQVTTEKNLELILRNATPVFKSGIGTLQHIRAKIVLKSGATPRFHKTRPVPYAIRPLVEKELDRLEANCILSKVDWSPWATPVVPIINRNGTVRLCGDFKVSINPVLQVEQYPLPRIEDIFASLSGGQRFSKLDLADAYLQMEVEEDSKVFLTINTIKGLYRYNRLVFGVASAPAIWQRAMDQILQSVPGVQCYLDDIIVTGMTDEEHLENLKKVLKRLEEYGLRARLGKCEFLKPSVRYCGHTIDAQGLHKCQDKIQAVLMAPQPQNVSQLRSFLGFVNYYNKFLPNLATVLYPLNELLQAGKQWKWSKECENSFQDAKRLVTSDTVLTHFNSSLPIKLACDASPYGIGAVMSHVMEDGSDRPIAFASRSLSAAEKNYAQIDREALSLVWGVKRFNQYLFGREFILVTDHQPLTSIFSPQKGVPATAAARMQRWALFLGGHRYKIEYKRTACHANADGLSRLPLEAEKDEFGDEETIDMISISQIENLPVTADMVKTETKHDKILSQVYAATLNGWTAQHKSLLAAYYSRRDEIALNAGCVMWGLRTIVPTKLRHRVLEELHKGHLGVVKMKALARSFVWWPGIDEDIEKITQQCSGCQMVQNEPERATLHPWEWPTLPWERLHFDFAGPFMGTTFLVVVDTCSKWPEVCTMSSTTTSHTIEVLRDLFARTGVPQQLVSDNGPQFTATDFQVFLHKNGIRHITSAPWHPAINGLVERFVQSLKQALRAMTNEKLTHQLDLLQPNIKQTVQDRQIKQGYKATDKVTRSFAIGQSVLARSYRGDQKWVPALVKEQTGPLSYKAEATQGVIWRRHVDQLRKSGLVKAEEMHTLPVDSPAVAPINCLEHLPSPQAAQVQSPCALSPSPSAETNTAVTNQEKLPCEERRFPICIRKPP